MEKDFDIRKNKSIIREEDIGLYLNEESIYIDDFNEIKVDMSRFLHLRHLSGHYKQMNNLDKATLLESLMIWGYTNKKSELSNLVNLKELILRQSSIMDLSFLSRMISLKKLELSYLSNLTDISNLVTSYKSLIVLEIKNCKKINHLDSALNELQNLRVLKLIGLELKDIYWVKNLPNLQQLIITNTNVLNGDISPARDIGYVAIDNKRHYNYKFDDETMKIVPK